MRKGTQDTHQLQLRCHDAMCGAVLCITVFNQAVQTMQQHNVDWKAQS
jgi:hypothetical protein